MKRTAMPTFTSVLNPTKRLGSGSACERCRTRKTKCDGGQPCAFCSSHNVPCIHRPANTNYTRKRKSPVTNRRTKYSNNTYFNTLLSNSNMNEQNQQQQQKQETVHEISANQQLPEYWKRNFKIPSIMDQLSCHTFTIEAAYSSCNNTWYS